MSATLSDVSSDLSFESREEKEHEEKQSEVVPEEEEPVALPLNKYSEEDMQLLVTKVKKFTTLFDLQEIDWNEDVYKVIRDFFINPTECILTIFFDEDKLSAKLGFPSKPAHDMSYFMKEPTDSITPTNFYKVINFGTIGPHVEGSILNVMENVYAPMFFNSTSWPDSILCS
uniref:Uncharacterized protein n=1 Tax=Timema poppense TaxID=170557 RepID=A0A7R9CH87_TIMPO|nr:unnamed protein product [Timema poppensis]